MPIRKRCISMLLVLGILLGVLAPAAQANSFEKTVSGNTDHMSSNTYTYVPSEDVQNDLQGTKWPIVDSLDTVSLGSTSGAITNDGSLYMWGDNDYGEVGNGSYGREVIEPVCVLSNVISIDIYGSRCAAITEDGSLYMWGDNRDGVVGNGSAESIQTTPVKVLEHVKTVIMGNRTTAAITEDGSLYLWGYNYYGAIGNGTRVDQSIPVKVLDDVVSVSTRYECTGALTADGSLYMWGTDFDGVLGNGDTQTDVLSPVKIMDNVSWFCITSSNIYQEAFLYLDCSAITTDGTLYRWGRNKYGTIGDGTTVTKRLPTKILENVDSIDSTKEGDFAALTQNGDLYVWGNGEFSNISCKSPKKVAENVEQYDLSSYGYGFVAQDGILHVIEELDTTDFSGVATFELNSITHNHSIITYDNSLYMWGSNNRGSCGVGSLGHQDTPVKILENVIWVSSPASHLSGAVTNDGKLFMWGNIHDVWSDDDVYTSPQLVLEDIRISDGSIDDAPESAKNMNTSVRYFYSWNAENQVAYFDTDPESDLVNLGSQVTGETDTTFLENVDNLVGQYVLVKTKPRDDGMIAPDTLISIKPVVTRTGIITAIDGNLVTIDDTVYAIPENLMPLMFSVGDKVMYHLYNEKIVGICEYTGENVNPEDPDRPDPVSEYKLVITPNAEKHTLEIGSALDIICDLYCGDERVTDWEQPQLSISYSGSDAPISYEGWNESWAGNYSLHIECVATGEAYLMISDGDTGASVMITIEVVPLDEAEFDDPSKAEWVTKHIQYAKSDTYQEQVVDGFSDELNTAFEEIKDDWTIGAYNTLDQVNKILALDIGALNETQEYELLLIQILFSRNGVVSIEDSYSSYLAESSVDILKKLFLNEEFTAGIDDQKLFELNERINNIDKLVNSNSEALESFQHELDALLTDIDDLNISISDACFDELQEVLDIFVGFSLNQIDDYCKSTKECIMYLAAGEAYSKTSDAFGKMLLEMRSHLSIPSDLVEMKQPLISGEAIMSMVDREIPIMGNTISYNPFDTPVSITELCWAIENYYMKLNSYRQDGGIQLAQKAVDSIRQGTAFNVFGTNVDVVTLIFEACPVVQAYEAVKDLFDGTQFIVDAFTGIDDKAYHGTMVMRLYCMARIHYITVNCMAENTEHWGMSWNTITGNVLDRNEQFDDATIFDEAVVFYRSIRSVATEYAKAYYTTPVLDAPKQYHGYLAPTSKMVAALNIEQHKLNYEWCHGAFNAISLDPSNLITYGLKCPISIRVANENGTVIAELMDNEWEVEPGYEQYFYITKAGEYPGDYFKTITVPKTYSVSICGTDVGEMDAVIVDDMAGSVDYFLDIPILKDREGYFIDSAVNLEHKQLLIDGTTLVGENEVHTHSYSDPLFSWTDDYSCTAIFTCTEQDDAQMTVCFVTNETTAATKSENGLSIYTATTMFNGNSYMDTKTVVLPKLENPFTDVPQDSFYYEPVMWAVERGITNGTTATTFNPNGTCLRAHVVTFLHRAAGNPEPGSGNNPFTDVKSSDFFYQPVLWAVEKGITNGTSATTFGSYANCNRAAVVTFLWRAAGSPEPAANNNPFVDVNTTDYFYKPVLWAVENGITNGVDATHFGPATDCNRAQVVTFLYRTAKINNEKPVGPTEPQPTEPGVDDSDAIMKVASGIDFYATLKSNGKVNVVSWNDILGSDWCEDWSDIVDIDANNYFVLGLQKNGTVVFEGVNVSSRGDVGDWSGIKQVSAGGFFSAGLKTNGTVVAVGSNDDGQCNVSDWTGIIAISTGFSHTVGLKADGTVVATGSNHMGQCDVAQWSDIIAIAAGDGITIGLKADGTVVTTCVNWFYNNPAWIDIREAEKWTDVIAIDAGGQHIVALKSNGTVVTAGFVSEETSSWIDVTAISAGGHHTVGLKEDGTIIVVQQPEGT